jgi:hypothetical protein
VTRSLRRSSQADPKRKGSIQLQKTSAMNQVGVARPLSSVGVIEAEGDVLRPESTVVSIQQEPVKKSGKKEKPLFKNSRKLLGIFSRFHVIPYNFIWNAKDDMGIPRIADSLFFPKLFICICASHTAFQIFQIVRLWSFYLETGQISLISIHAMWITAFTLCMTNFLHLFFFREGIQELLQQTYIIEKEFEGQ